MTACLASNTRNGRRYRLPNGVLWQRWARYALADPAQTTTPALALALVAGVVLSLDPCPSEAPGRPRAMRSGPQGPVWPSPRGRARPRSRAAPDAARRAGERAPPARLPPGGGPRRVRRPTTTVGACSNAAGQEMQRQSTPNGGCRGPARVSTVGSPLGTRSAPCCVA